MGWLCKCSTDRQRAHARCVNQALDDIIYGNRSSTTCPTCTAGYDTFQSPLFRAHFDILLPLRGRVWVACEKAKAIMTRFCSRAREIADGE